MLEAKYVVDTRCRAYPAVTVPSDRAGKTLLRARRRPGLAHRGSSLPVVLRNRHPSRRPRAGRCHLQGRTPAWSASLMATRSVTWPPPLRLAVPTP